MKNLLQRKRALELAKKRIVYAAASGVLLASFSSTTVLALETAPTVTQTQTAPAKSATEQKAAMDQRVAQYKANLKTKLDAATQKRITTKCKTAQTLITGIETRSQTVGQKRIKIYDGISTRLATIIDKLSRQNIPTSDLTSLQNQLSTAVANFKSDLTLYQQQLDDLAKLDCVADPTGFKAALDSARAAHDGTLVKDAAAIRELVAQISKALVVTKQSLSNSSGSNSVTNSNSSTTKVESKTGSTR